MKMVRAVVRPEKESVVTIAIANASFPTLTKWDVLGRGKQQGIQVGSKLYEDLPKSMILIVVEDDQAESVVGVIRDAAFTEYPGDGKIFVTPVESAHTIRTGKAQL